MEVGPVCRIRKCPKGFWLLYGISHVQTRQSAVSVVSGRAILPCVCVKRTCHGIAHATTHMRKCSQSDVHMRKKRGELRVRGGGSVFYPSLYCGVQVSVVSK